jgi:hypothetical protein
MEIPWSKWMEFVILGTSIVFGLICVFIIDRSQKPAKD